MVYVDRLLQLFRYVPREQLTIPDFVFQLVVCPPEISSEILFVIDWVTMYFSLISFFRHDLEINGGRGLVVDPRPKYFPQRSPS